MSKRRNFRILRVTYHNWEIVKQQDNIVLLKCTCCKEQPRIAVAKQYEKTTVTNGTTVTSLLNDIYYSGYDYDYALKEFNRLLRWKQQQEEFEKELQNVSYNNQYTPSTTTITISNVTINVGGQQ